jgi:hypothetical protein
VGPTSQLHLPPYRSEQMFPFSRVCCDSPCPAVHAPQLRFALARGLGFTVGPIGRKHPHNRTSLNLTAKHGVRPRCRHLLAGILRLPRINVWPPRTLDPTNRVLPPAVDYSGHHRCWRRVDGLPSRRRRLIGDIALLGARLVHGGVRRYAGKLMGGVRGDGRTL